MVLCCRVSSQRRTTRGRPGAPRLPWGSPRTWAARPQRVSPPCLPPPTRSRTTLTSNFYFTLLPTYSYEIELDLHVIFSPCFFLFNPVELAISCRKPRRVYIIQRLLSLPFTPFSALCYFKICIVWLFVLFFFSIRSKCCISCQMPNIGQLILKGFSFHTRHNCLHWNVIWGYFRHCATVEWNIDIYNFYAITMKSHSFHFLIEIHRVQFARKRPSTTNNNFCTISLPIFRSRKNFRLLMQSYHFISRHFK